MSGFADLPPVVDLPAIEHEMLRRWRDAKVFERSLEQTAGGQPWIFYEGPPTANGMPGVHHIEARVLKDAFPRFKTMQGYHVPRRAGWDCHGLPVEVAVEKELGLTAKKDIEAYGIAEFNARCRESVLRHVDAFAEMTERMGYWIDLSAAYRTMDPAYIESVWWSLKQIYDQGLLVRDHRISPYCPRCGTPLSDHEMGQPDVYQTVTDPSVTVRFPLRDAARGRQPRAARRRPAGLDHDAVDAGVEHRRGRAPRRDLRDRPAVRPRRPGGGGRRPVRPGARARAGTSPTGSAAPSWPARSTSRRSSSSTCPTRTGWSPPRS